MQKISAGENYRIWIWLDPNTVIKSFVKQTGNLSFYGEDVACDLIGYLGETVVSKCMKVFIILQYLYV